MSGDPHLTQGGDLRSPQTATRETRQWWCVDDHYLKVAEATGYICENAPGAWWVPAVGYTMWEGTHLFPTRPQALRALLVTLTKRREELVKAIRRVEDQLGV